MVMNAIMAILLQGCERMHETASIWRRRLIVAILPRFGASLFHGICTVGWSGQALRRAVITVQRTKAVGTARYPLTPQAV